MTTETLDHGQMTVAVDFLPLLRSHRLDGFDRVMGLAGGHVMRDFPGRRTVRLALQTPAGGEQRLFLKRYRPEYLSAWRRLLRRAGWPSAQDEAQREWTGLQAVRRLGIGAATPVACGRKIEAGLVTESFLMTAEIERGQDGDHYLREHSGRDRRRFLVQVAALARRLHDAGWFHKDLYVSHILVTPGQTSESALQLFLIDLQRLTRIVRGAERWRVKDLAALAYSALKAGASPRDLLSAWREYCGARELNEEHRVRARHVLRRVAWLKTRTPKHDKDFRQLA